MASRRAAAKAKTFSMVRAGYAFGISEEGDNTERVSDKIR